MENTYTRLHNIVNRIKKIKSNNTIIEPYIQVNNNESERTESPRQKTDNESHSVKHRKNSTPCDDSDCELSLELSCLNIFSLPPSWKLRKCIQICDETCDRPIKTHECEIKSPCDENSLCCDTVKLWAFPGDNLEVQYVIMASKTSEGALVYTGNLILCSKESALHICSLKIIVEEKIGSFWEEIPGTLVKRELDLNVCGCANITISGSFPDSNTNTIRLKIIVEGSEGKCKSILYETLDKDAIQNHNNINKWCIKDPGIDGFPREITDSITFCTPPTLYEFSLDCKDEPICNVAELHEGACCDEADESKHKKGCITKSNKTELIRKCSKFILCGNAVLECKNNERWCVCKQSKNVILEHDGREKHFLEYTINATRNRKIEECILEWDFTFKVDKLSYKKEFTYTIEAGDVLTSDTFELGPGNNLSIELSGRLCIDSESANQPTVKICWTKDTYNLSTCCIEKSVETECITKFLNLKTKHCDVCIRLTDDLVSNPLKTAILADPNKQPFNQYKQFILEHTFIKPANPKTNVVNRINKLLSHEGIDPTIDLGSGDTITYNYLVCIYDDNKCVNNTVHISVKGNGHILNECSSMISDKMGHL